MSQYDRPGGGRSRSVPPTARLAGGSAPTPVATPTVPASTRAPVDASKWASKRLADFIEQKTNMGHNNSHPDGPQSQAPVGGSAGPRRTGGGGGQPAAGAGPQSTGFRVNLSSPAAGGDQGSGVALYQPIRSLKRRAGASSYGPASSPFATDLTPKQQT